MQTSAPDGNSSQFYNSNSQTESLTLSEKQLSIDASVFSNPEESSNSGSQNGKIQNLNPHQLKTSYSEYIETSSLEKIETKGPQYSDDSPSQNRIQLESQEYVEKNVDVKLTFENYFNLADPQSLHNH